MPTIVNGLTVDAHGFADELGVPRLLVPISVADNRHRDGAARSLFIGSEPPPFEYVDAKSGEVVARDQLNEGLPGLSLLR